MKAILKHISEVDVHESPTIINSMHYLFDGITIHKFSMCELNTKYFTVSGYSINRKWIKEVKNDINDAFDFLILEMVKS